jgi:PKD repeat protein
MIRMHPEGFQNNPPVAVITSNPAINNGNVVVTTAQALRLDSSNSTDSDFDLLDVFWDFGDGVNSTNPVTTHIYGTPGIYLLALTVSDVVEATSTEHVVVNVTQATAPPPSFSPAPGPQFGPTLVNISNIMTGS